MPLSEAARQAKMKFYRRSPSKLPDFQKALETTKFLVILGDTHTYSEAGYDPGDSCTTGYHYSLKMVTLESEAEIAEWVKAHIEDSPNVPYQIIKVDPVTINTSISVSIG